MDSNKMNQQSPEWLAARSGHCTASRFKDVLAKLRNGGEASERKKYRLQLVTERLTGQPCPSYVNEAMQWGTATEPFARAAYETAGGLMVDETGFLLHPSLEWVGGSPDGLVRDDGLIEIKCPFNSVVHVETMLSGMPSEHMAQVQGLLWITGRDWVDFISFDPRMPPKIQLYVERVKREPTYIELLEQETVKFLGEVEKQHEWILSTSA